MNATNLIYKLVYFGIDHGLVEEQDFSYTVNRLLEIMQMDAPEEGVAPERDEVRETATVYLEGLCDAAVATGVLADSGEMRDLFSAKLMGVFTPSPAETRAKFFAIKEKEGPEAATKWFYQMCRDTDYVRVDRIAKNERFLADSPAGKLEITINLSKPEKDPRDIIAQRKAKQTGYPKCMLCQENPGYAGRIGFPARQNHRMIPLTLSGKRWFMQYSPYLYYNEHCIVLNGEHQPMKLTRGSFERLFEFVGQFPHYFLGSNADLPIVGGSILSHDHFQGGSYRFPMDEAGVRRELVAPVDGVNAWIADWPMSCVRLTGDDAEQLIDLGYELLEAWRKYSDPDCGIYAETDQPHNTVTPIVRKENGKWRLDLVLRNNRTDEENPLGIFHPHADLHHIKKENIGLIEVMGLFILPGRLKAELADLAKYLTGEKDVVVRPEESDPLEKHYDWVKGIAESVGTNLSEEAATLAIREALAVKCARVLADAGVYKNDEKGTAGMVRFLETIGYKAK